MVYIIDFSLLQRLSPVLQSPVQSPTHERHAFAYRQDPSSVVWQSGVETKVSTPIEVNWRKIDSGKNPRQELVERPRRKEVEANNSVKSPLSSSFQNLRNSEVIQQRM
jgi:hypothetical protein